jgi:hypothetical protein
LKLSALLPASLAAVPVALTLVGAQRGNTDQTASILSYIDAHNGEALSLVERIVNINSGTRNLEGVREVGRVLRTELDGLGFQTQMGGWRGVAARGTSGGRATCARRPCAARAAHRPPRHGVRTRLAVSEVRARWGGPRHAGLE